MLQNATDIKQKGAEQYICEHCDYFTLRKNNFDRHILTLKHQYVTKQLLKSHVNCSKISNNTQPINEFSCPNCDKIFKHHSSMYRHKKNCNITTNQNQNTCLFGNNLESIIIDIFSKQADKMLEIIKSGTHNTTNNTTNNMVNSNNSFNLNFYLHETCKNAMNIEDFVSSIQLQLSDLEKTGELGYVKGITKIICDNLNKLETTKRPIHCSDAKREVLYIKDNNEWIKETKNKDIIKNAVRNIANKNIQQIPEWTKQNPGCNHSDNKKNDKYLQILLNNMSGSTIEEQKNNIDKIVTNIAKQVIIQKN